jgi:hypothetical protein
MACSTSPRRLHWNNKDFNTFMFHNKKWKIKSILKPRKFTSFSGRKDCHRRIIIMFSSQIFTTGSFFPEIFWKIITQKRRKIRTKPACRKSVQTLAHSVCLCKLNIQCFCYTGAFTLIPKLVASGDGRGGGDTLLPSAHRCPFLTGRIRDHIFYSSLSPLPPAP